MKSGTAGHYDVLCVRALVRVIVGGAWANGVVQQAVAWGIRGTRRSRENMELNEMQQMDPMKTAHLHTA